MNLRVLLSFKELLGIEIEDPEQLLADLDWNYTLSYLAFINSMVRAGRKFEEIFGFISRGWSVELKESLINLIDNYLVRHNSSSGAGFNRPVLIDFIQYEAHKRRVVEGFQENVESSQALFLGYIWFSEKYGDKISKDNAQKITSDLGSFQSKYWPSLLRQYCYTYNVDERLEFHKAVVFFNTVYQDDELKQNLAKFLEYHKTPTHTHYIVELGKLIHAGRQLVKDSKPSFTLTVTEPFKGYLDNFSITKISDASEFEHVMITPTMNVDKGSYVVLDWGFLTNKLYQGAIHYFFNYGNFTGSQVKKNFNDYKSYIGKEIIEKRIFKPVIEKIFNKKQIKIEFDIEERIQGSTDAFVLDNNQLYLFELKDVEVRKTLFFNCEVDNFTKFIDKNFVKKKGIKQLQKLMTSIGETKAKEYDIGELETKKITVFPILVVTDYILTMPGIDDYVKKNIDTSAYSKYYEHCHLPVVIPLSFLFNHIGDIKNVGLDKMITWYNELIKEWHLNEKGLDHETFMTSYEGLVQIFQKYNSIDKDYNNLVQKEMLSEIEYVFE